MKNKWLVILALCLLGETNMVAADWNAPEKYSFVIADDCKVYNDTIKKAYEWYMNAPITTRDEERTKNVRFIHTWINASPDVDVFVCDELIPFDKNIPELVTAYMLSWSVYQLETGDKKDRLSAGVFAIEKTLDYYEKNKKGKEVSSKFKKQVKTFSKLRKQGKLKDYVDKVLNNKEAGWKKIE